MRFRDQASADAFAAKNPTGQPVSKPRTGPTASKKPGGASAAPVPGIGKRAGIKNRKDFDAAVSTMPDREKKRLGNVRGAREAGKADMVNAAERTKGTSGGGRGGGWGNEPRGALLGNPGRLAAGSTATDPNSVIPGKGPAMGGPRPMGPPSGGIFAGGGGPSKFPGGGMGGPGQSPPWANMPPGGGGFGGPRDLPSPPQQNPWGPGAEGGMAPSPDSPVSSSPPQPMGLADAVGMGGGLPPGAKLPPRFGGDMQAGLDFAGANPQSRFAQALNGGPSNMGGPGAGGGGMGGGGNQPFQGTGILPPPQGAARAQMGQALRRRMAPQGGGGMQQLPPMTNPGFPGPGQSTPY